MCLAQKSASDPMDVGASISVWVLGTELRPLLKRCVLVAAEPPLQPLFVLLTNPGYSGTHNDFSHISYAFKLFKLLTRAGFMLSNNFRLM